MLLKWTPPDSICFDSGSFSRISTAHLLYHLRPWLRNTCMSVCSPQPQLSPQHPPFEICSCMILIIVERLQFFLSSVFFPLEYKCEEGKTFWWMCKWTNKRIFLSHFLSSRFLASLEETPLSCLLTYLPTTTTLISFGHHFLHSQWSNFKFFWEGVVKVS